MSTRVRSRLVPGSSFTSSWGNQKTKLYQVLKLQFWKTLKNQNHVVTGNESSKTMSLVSPEARKKSLSCHVFHIIAIQDKKCTNELYIILFYLLMMSLTAMEWEQWCQKNSVKNNYWYMVKKSWPCDMAWWWSATHSEVVSFYILHFILHSVWSQLISCTLFAYGP